MTQVAMWNIYVKRYEAIISLKKREKKKNNQQSITGCQTHG